MPDPFLIEAASVVPLSSSTSSHLLATHSHLLHNTHKSLNVRQKRDYCGACGSIRKPEWTKVTEIKPKSRKHLAASAAKGASVYKCLRCQRRTVLQHIQPLTSRTSAATATPSSAPDPTSGAAKGPTQASTESKSGDNQNSKKRAKARKQGGLQALLASKQQAQPSLDLLDFLQ
ncbi:unnamed protein product [Penicillium salamii]|uniref:Uncharacterized protein n=1 Tax=Penicillium salamii TaxID=1612424 RepID=A0A9W4IYI9_9EURO|nr:unnamed protein product [Penicillium salamii]CAG7966846.1 unnamed protein product [Penicillium salamii]CAG8003154.1 unnamed protein product [Penicillium salamii]CAG8052039.1 unnamed protein product [Penicillium salamii]CAG8200108.1 unnamed protein product [Penicillium salamii]